MLKSKFPIIALLLVTVLSGRFNDIVNMNKQILTFFWDNNVSLNITGIQSTVDLISSDITPLVWKDNSVIAAYLKRSKGQALIMPKALIDKLSSKKNCDALCNQWRMIVFGSTSLTTEDATTYFAKPESKRSNKIGVVVTESSTGFDVKQTMRDWEAGKVGVLILQHFNMESNTANNKLSELAHLMGFFFSGATVNVDGLINGLTYKPIQSLMPYGLTLQAWTDNATTINDYPVRFTPFNDDRMANRLAKFPSYGEAVYNFMMKYDKLLQDNPVNEDKPIDQRSGHPFSLKFFVTYVRQSFSQSLKFIDKERLDKLTYKYGIAGGFVDTEGLTVPTVGEYLIKMNCKSNINIPLKIDIKPHSTIEYEVITETNEPMDIGAGAFYDGLSNKNRLVRVPDGRASELMGRKGLFYSPIGGPLIINPREYRGELVVKFKNVYRSIGMDIKDPDSITVWDSGVFNNTKARFATLVCDVFYFTVEFNTIKNFSSQFLKDICKTHDHMVKSFASYIGGNVMNRERYHFVFDPQPIWGAAHSGQPMVLPMPWTEDMVDITNRYLRQTETEKGWWGLLHEVGHMFQSDYWDFGIFGETTNNVLVLMFQERYLNMPLSAHKAHPKMYEMEILFNYINNVGEKMHQIWAGLHFHYHLVPSFGWAMFGNVYNRYANETGPDRSMDRFARYLSDETGYNMAPYIYYFRLDYLAKNITQVYQEYAHLPTFKPYDTILNNTTQRWNETRQFFGFTNDVQVNITLPFKFNPDLNFDTMAIPSPTVEKL